MDLSEIETKIDGLEKRKAGLLERITTANKRLRYKQYEHKALKPFVEQTKNIRIGPLRRKKNAVEFRIATQAYTPRMEREWLKEVKKIDQKLAEVREIEWARRKLRLVENDVTECEKQIAEVEPQLQQIREQLKKLYDNARSLRQAARRAVQYGPRDEMVTLGDIGIIEKGAKG